MDIKDLENRFSFHPATDDKTKQAHDTVRGDCLRFAIDLNKLLRDSDEKEKAIDKLDEVMFWANAAIARNSNALH
jgi:hypothetical protein